MFSKIKAIFSIKQNKNNDIKKHLEEVEESLLTNDCGTTITNTILQSIKQKKNQDTYEVARIAITEILKNAERSMTFSKDELNTIVICGINGSGKTSASGKIAHYLKKTFNQKILLAACDTFRAAATEQLQMWSNKIQVDFFSDNEIKSPSAMAYKAVMYAKQHNYDTIIIDTAGRLSNDTRLMSELEKTIRSINKASNTTMLQTLMVLDGTLGQNCYQQLQQFKDFADVKGLVITKLDGSSKGGALIGLVKQYNLPIYFITTGEEKQDLHKFDANEFTKALFKHNK